MEIVYESMRATTWRDMMALKATDDPMLMRDRSSVNVHVSATAFAGICFVGWTAEIQFENGRPLSRAKAKVWRDVDALKLTLDKITIIIRRIVRALIPDVETACRNTPAI